MPLTKFIAPFSRRLFSAAVGTAFFISLPVFGQQPDSRPVVVQPGAPGQPTRILPASTRAKLPPIARKDVEFMQGMIMHHAQAVEMSALIDERTKDRDIKLLGTKISQSQTDEMKFMRNWLEFRGEGTAMPAAHTPSTHSHSGHAADHHMLMPGMLSPEQMTELKNANAAEFDRLFLTGMIQHHKGALVMVDELFNSAGTGQDAELFNFATDVDSGQRAEIKTMETLLARKP